MAQFSIRYICFPRTEPPPSFVEIVAAIFRKHEAGIGTRGLDKGLKSDEVLSVIRDDLIEIGFQVEGGKQKNEKIERPVFFGENGQPALEYQIDGYHPAWRCGLEVEAARAWMGNAIYRDLVQGLVMVEVDNLILAVPNMYKYKADGHEMVSTDFDNTVRVADALYGHTRVRFPYRLIVIGY